MSIFGVANGTLSGTSRRHATAHRYDCRAQQYMSEPIPPPPTPPVRMHTLSWEMPQSKLARTPHTWNRSVLISEVST